MPDKKREPEKKGPDRREGDVVREALQGLKRMAFAPVNGAVSLVLAEDPASVDAGSLDLFAVQEIRRPRGGGLEIRFFDRLKALELLLVHGERATGESPAASLLEALQRGVGEDLGGPAPNPSPGKGTEVP